MELKEFDDLINFGRLTKEVKFGPRTIVIRTLSSLEYGKISARFNDKGDSQAEKFEKMQREIVAAAIGTIDGKEYGHAEKVTLIGMAQLGLANKLYNEYIALTDEQNTLLDEVKKNSSQEAPLKS